MKKAPILGALIVLLAIAGPVYAANNGKGNGGKGGGKGNTSTTSLPPIQLNEDPATLSLGSVATFSYSADTSIKYPEITVHCYKGDVKVWGDTQMAAGNSFLLGGDFWSPWKEAGGGASCVATLFYFSNTDSVIELGSTTFTVS